MSDRSPTPPGRMEVHTQPVNVDDSYAKADMPLDSNPSTPRQRKRRLDDELYVPDTTAGAQRDAQGKTPKKRKTVSSLPSYVKLNVIREVATVRATSQEDRPQCVVSGASDKRTVIEFSHIVSGSTPASEVSEAPSEAGIILTDERWTV